MIALPCWAGEEALTLGLASNSIPPSPAEEQVVTLEQVLKFKPPSKRNETVVTLDKVLKVAFERNPRLKASGFDVLVSKTQVTQANSEYMPQISINGTYKRAYINNKLIAAALGGKSAKQFNYYKTGFVLDQYLYGFGQKIGKIEKARQNFSASEKSYDQSASDLVYAVKNAYYEVLKRRDYMYVQEEALRTEEFHLTQAKELYKHGIRPKVDVARAEVQASRTRDVLITASYDVLLAKVELENLLGGPPVEGPFRLAEVSIQPYQVDNLEALTMEAMGKRPLVKKMKAQVRAAEAQKKSVFGEYFPAFNATGIYGWQDVVFPPGNEWFVGMSLAWNILPGLQTYGRVNEAKASILKQRSLLEQTKLNVILEVSQAALLVNEFADKIATSKVTIKWARENMELVQGRYVMGISDAIEYADAVFELTDARDDLVQATYGYLQARANLNHAIGRGLTYTAEPRPPKGNP